MSKNKTAAIVLAAGLGTRMKSTLPKVLHPLGGVPMIRHLMETLDGLEMDRIVVVVGEDMPAVVDAVAPCPTVTQTPRLGSGDAVLTARAAFEGFTGDVLVVYGDTPLITKETLGRLIAARRAPLDPAVAVLGFCPAEPGRYGRLILAPDGTLETIIEARDANPEQLAVGFCNSGVIAVDGKRLFPLIEKLDNGNAAGEYYLTDIVAGARADGFACAVVEGDGDELIGIDTRADLAAAEATLQRRLRGQAMLGGATLIDPASVYFSHDTCLGKDVTIGPSVVFGPGVSVGDRAEIRPFCHIEGTSIAASAVVGPFARLRPGADIAEDAHIGNFVEIKNAAVESGAKINHLTYIGDARVGAKANVGAGTITCNYDGFSKSRTDIGGGVFIGSNTALVAPVKIGDGAIVGAGSVISEDVEANALALTRAGQKNIKGGGERYRQRRRAAKKPGTKKTER